MKAKEVWCHSKCFVVAVAVGGEQSNSDKKHAGERVRALSRAALAAPNRKTKCPGEQEGGYLPTPRACGKALVSRLSLPMHAKKSKLQLHSRKASWQQQWDHRRGASLVLNRPPTWNSLRGWEFEMIP